jgi:hypothetical protein
LIAVYSRANWTAPIVKPNDATNRIGTSGRLTKKIAGTAAKKKRRLVRSNGGISLTPSLTATKLVPRIRTVMSATKISRSFIVIPYFDNTRQFVPIGPLCRLAL